MLKGQADDAGPLNDEVGHFSVKMLADSFSEKLLPSFKMWFSNSQRNVFVEWLTGIGSVGKDDRTPEIDHFRQVLFKIHMSEDRPDQIVFPDLGVKGLDQYMHVFFRQIHS